MTQLNLEQMTELLSEQYIKRNISRFTVEKTEEGEDVVTVVKNDNEFRCYHFNTKESVMEFIKPKPTDIPLEEFIVNNMSDESIARIKEETNRLIKEEIIESSATTGKEFLDEILRPTKPKLTLDKVRPIPGDILNIVDWGAFESYLRSNGCIGTIAQMKYQWSKLVVLNESDNFINLDRAYADGEVFASLDKGMMRFFEIIGNERDNSPIFYDGDKIVCIDEGGFANPDKRYYSENFELLKHSDIKVGNNEFGDLVYLTDYNGNTLFDEDGMSVSNLTKDELKYFRKRK